MCKVDEDSFLFYNYCSLLFFFSLTVMATDSGIPVLSGSSVVNVNVIDINDNSPTFPPARFVKISEGENSILRNATQISYSK